MSAPPLIAIVGRPNVGKSTLYNRLVGGRPALVHDTPGVTRDRRYGEIDYFGRRFRVVDTGGLDPEAAREVIGAGIHRQAERALAEADAVLFLVDGRAGLTPIDRELAVKLRKLGLPIFCAVNKLDSPKRDDLAGEIYALGLGEVYPISAAHGRGIDELMDAVCAALPAPPAPPEPHATRAAEPVDIMDALDEPGEPEREDGAGDALGRPLRVALVGKPNAGKSSLLNRLVGAERSLVHDAPGTTTDPVDTPFEIGGRQYILVDTAGIRRRARIDEATEKLSVSLALGQIDRADVVVLVVDATDGPTEQDARLAGIIAESGRAVVIALNKADALSGKHEAAELRQRVRDQLHFLDWAPVHMMSALRGDGVDELLDRADEVAREHARRVSTAELNRFFAEVCETHPPPTHSGRVVTIHYMTQGGVRPPTFLLWANRPKDVQPAYKRYVVNQLRQRYGFEGTPMRVVVKSKVGKVKQGKGRRR